MLGLFWGERSGAGSDPTRRTGRRAAATRRAHRPALEGLEERIVLATDTWTGAVGANWMTAGNWSGGVAPAPGDSLLFPAAANNLTNTNDFPAGTGFNAITIQGAGYNIAGNALSLSSGITASYTTGTSSYKIDTTLTAIVAPITVSSSPTAGTLGTLDIAGVLSGSAGVNVAGGGILDLISSSPNTYTGATTIASGTTLIVDSTIGGVQNNGGLLSGNGSVGAISSVGGAVLPGHPAASTTTGLAAPGQLIAQSGLTLDSGSEFDALLNGTSPGNGVTGYSQLVVSAGTVNLGGAKLGTALGTSYTPMVGNQLRIIANNTGAPVNGIFTGLPEGAAVLASNSLFRISYLGVNGAGNDVVLSAVLANSTTTLLPVSIPTVPNQPVTLTAQVTGSQGIPTGTVEFFNGNPATGGTLLGTAALNSSGMATTTTSLSNVNSSTALYAVYVPTPTSFIYAGSTSTPITFATTTTLTSSSPVSGVGEPVSFTATVLPSSAGAGTPTGSVQFSIDGTAVGTVPLNAATGQATYTTATLSIGSHIVIATYVPNAPFLSSVSSILAQSVSMGGTLPVVTLVPVVNRHGRVTAFNLVANVVPSNAALGVPTGSVTFFINGRAFYRIVPLTNGTAVLRRSAARLLNHFVYARYNGSSAYIASASDQFYVSHRLLTQLAATAPRGRAAVVRSVRHRRR